MRTVALALMAVGSLFALAGGALRFAGWTGQQGARDPWVGEVSESRRPMVDFTRLSFPGHHADFIVRDGASIENLLLGPVRLKWSSALGARGNSVIAAHRDTHFRILKDLKKGELVRLEHNGHLFEYRIVALEIVRPADSIFYQPTSNAVLTLVTCYPFYYVGPAPKRFIVRAELLDTKT